MRDFGRRVAEERIRHGWTQADFAEKAEVSLRYVQSIEQGQENMTLKSATLLAYVLRVDLRELLTAPTTPRPKRGRPKRVA